MSPGQAWMSNTPLALPTLEVVVMVVADRLEARVLAGQVHGLQLAVFDQGLEVAIDRRDAQAGHLLLRRVEHFLR